MTFPGLNFLQEGEGKGVKMVKQLDAQLGEQESGPQRRAVDSKGW